MWLSFSLTVIILKNPSTAKHSLLPGGNKLVSQAAAISETAHHDKDYLDE
jgi:hypothetical protein